MQILCFFRFATVITGTVSTLLACETGAGNDSGTGADVVLAICEREAVIQHLLGGSSAVDCGDLWEESDAVTIRAANECVAEAHGARRPFRFGVTPAGNIDSDPTTYLGSDLNGHYVVFVMSSYSFGPTTATWTQCTEFSVAEECALVDAGRFAPTDPCISCEADETTVCACSSDDNNIVHCPPSP